MKLLGWVFFFFFFFLILYAHALHSHCILTMFHAFRCVFDIVDCVLVGLDWVLPMMTLIFACHMFMHFSCIRLFFSFLFLVICCNVFSLSLSQIDCAWHPKRISPHRLETLLVLGLLLLLILSPLFTFGSVMGRPKRTSWRTFRNVAFIRGAMLFCRPFPTLLSPSSFELGAGNLFVRDP